VPLPIYCFNSQRLSQDYSISKLNTYILEYFIRILFVVQKNIQPSSSFGSSYVIVSQVDIASEICTWLCSHTVLGAASLSAWVMVCYTHNQLILSSGNSETSRTDFGEVFGMQSMISVFLSH
jgi:hypothetical protein